MSKMCWALVASFVITAAARAEPPKPDFPAWSKAGKDMKSTPGFWSFHQDKKKRKFWVEIPSSQINRPFLLATSISGGTTMAGWQWNDWFLVWEVNDKRLVLLERNVGYMAKGRAELKEAVTRTYTDRVVSTYRIIAKGPGGGWVIDGKGFFASGAPTFFGGMGRSKDSSLAKFSGSKNFPENTEISVQMPSSSGTLITLHYSISSLPKTGYKPRLADDRIGYFTTVLKDFSPGNKDDNRWVRYVNRWHLVKEDPKLKLSPPKEPIIFYIEKTVPVKLRRAVRDGILEWNKAFEKVGFDGAIVVRQQTNTRYADLDPEDTRYNFFRWIYSGSAFAMGPSRVNPMTGQILDADIIFDDDYVRYTLQEYRLTLKEVPVAITGRRGAKMLATHPFARFGIVPAPDEFGDAIPSDAARPFVRAHARRAFCSLGRGVQHQIACAGLYFADVKPPAEGAEDKNQIPDELLQQVVKDTVMHEVGHTLGLRHNFKASIYRSYDEINSEAKPDDITGSVMEYSPVVIAPEGRTQGNYSMRTLGPYDHWAIEYGYTMKKADLTKITSRVAEKGLDYATDEDTWGNDPYVARWDMGADPLNYAKERVALMKRLRKTLEARAVDKGEAYNRLRRAMNMQLYEGRGAGRIALRFVGGEHMHRDHRGDPNARAPLVPVTAEKQREALDWICSEILSGKYFDFPPELLRKLAPDFWGDDIFAFIFGAGHGYPYLDRVLAVQFSMVYGLTGPDRLARVIGARHKTPVGQDVLTAPEIFDALHATIFANLKEAAARKSSNQVPALNDMQRNLQREYVGHLIYILIEGEMWYPATIQTLVRHYVKRLAAEIKGVLDGDHGLDTYSLSHLEECQTRLARALEASYKMN